MKKLILLFSLFIPFLIVAEGSYQSFRTDNEYYLLADNVNIRSTASTSSNIVATLPIATKITFKEKLSSTLKVGKLTANWSKISFTHPKTKQVKQGYVWGGFIAEECLESKSNPALCFLYGLSEIKIIGKDQKEIHLQIRVIQNQKEIYKTTFKAVGSEYISRYVECFGNKGVPKIHNILNFSFSQEMCGGLNGDIVFFWDGEKLFLVKQFNNGSDAPFYLYSMFLYPTDDGGKQGRIILKTEDGGEDEEGKEYENIEKEEYYWTGIELRKVN